ncbi:MAG: CPBP family intramembrane metalloprotease [Planctomycetales bacterium]|nr:CPBP family intramembrane metalloprotease [Planctomycetales bacterium]
MLVNNLFPGLLAEFNLLAQAAAAPEQITPGATIAGFLVLGIMASSVWMIVVWIGRRNLTGHALPAARRGILRVPPALTFVGIGLSLLMFLLMTLVSLQEKPGAKAASKPVANPVAASSAETSSSTADTSPTAEESTAPEVKPTETTSAETTSAEANPPSEKSDKKKSAASQMTPEDMQSALIQTVVMDAFLFLVFGVVVFVARLQGRARLSESAALLPSPQTQAYQTVMYSPANFWPDLDDASAAPMPGYPLPVERAVTPSGASSVPSHLEASESPWAAPQAESSISSSAEMISQGETPGETSGEVDEPFSFLTELRYAAEVFLAAYVPTAMLRVLVVALTAGLTGEVPDQHPFLEMMESDVGTAVLGLIALTAVVLAPIVEELQFRVVILGGIAQLGRPWLALGVSSVLFAFAHGFPDSLALLPLAFALGYAYLRRRSYITVMLVHFLFNAFNMVLAFLSMF